MKEAALQWIMQHGYFGIFSLLVLGIIGLPIPDEWLLALSGYFVFRQTFRFVPTFTAAFLGSACGITVSYVLGRTFGTYLLVHYGSKFHVGHDDVERVHRWFRRIGRWTLTFGYFVPGVRHLTAYIAGATGLEVPTFALFAYGGALVWSLTFISLGYYLGERSSQILEMVHSAGWMAMLAALFVLVTYLFLKRRKSRTRVQNA